MSNNSNQDNTNLNSIAQFTGQYYSNTSQTIYNSRWHPVGFNNDNESENEDELFSNHNRHADTESEYTDEYDEHNNIYAPENTEDQEEHLSEYDDDDHDMHSAIRIDDDILPQTTNNEVQYSSVSNSVKIFGNVFKENTKVYEFLKENGDITQYTAYKPNYSTSYQILPSTRTTIAPSDMYRPVQIVLPQRRGAITGTIDSTINNTNNIPDQQTHIVIDENSLACLTDSKDDFFTINVDTHVWIKNSSNSTVAVSYKNYGKILLCPNSTVGFDSGDENVTYKNKFAIIKFGKNLQKTQKVQLGKLQRISNQFCITKNY